MLVQVTASSVRLVSRLYRNLLYEWREPTRLSIIIVIANATQILFAIGRSQLVYLEIGERSLTEVKHLAIEFDVSCLDINPNGENPNRSEMAVVGLWEDFSI